MAFFVFIIGGMSAAALEDFMVQPSGILADVKMLHFFEHMSTIALIVIGVLALLSVFVKNFWCRYACPYGAVLSLASLASPIKIRRDQESCIDCGQCGKACPQNLPVNRLIQVSSAECSACMECVASCNTQDALQFALRPRTATPIAQRWRGRRLQPVAVVIILATLFFGGVGLARLSHHWQTNVSDGVYQQLIPHVDEDSHPGF
jgi:polyferredoxin